MRMRWMLSWTLSLAALGCAGAPTRGKPEGQRVELADAEPGCDPEKSTKCLCVGSAGEATAQLLEVGVDPNVLRTSGWPCVRGDFDQDGEPDYAFPGEGYSCNQSVPVRVLFTRGGRVREVRALPREVSCLQLYGPRSEPGPYGEPTTARQGLVDWGEGNATWIYLFDGKDWLATSRPSESS
jgi:hypothetical protein